MTALALRWAGAPEQLEPLAALAASLDVARELPFEPNLWTPQNAFFTARGRAFDAMTERASSDSVAAQWVELFLAVGEKLGIVVDAEKKKADERRARPGIAALVEELIETRHVPDATYRLQFNAGFTFPAARELVGYFRDLGISDVYASPILQARPGSMHGYDICDHSHVSDELGGEAALLELAQALDAEEHGAFARRRAEPHGRGQRLERMVGGRARTRRELAILRLFRHRLEPDEP